MDECRAASAHLLVGLDFSDTSGCALLEARRLRPLLQARVSLVHVVTSSEHSPWDADAMAWLRTYDADPSEIETRLGRTWSELARAAEERDATAIVIGSHGVSGFQPLALGSTAQRLTLLAPCPVIIVGPGQQRRRTAAARPPRGVHHPLP
jgi:nucleotide-binding universal stress UspA family protein